jgi:hypothetical protein
MRPRGEPQENDEVGDVARKGLGREEQQQIEAAIDAQNEEVRLPEEGEAPSEPLEERAAAPHEDKGLSR